MRSLLTFAVSALLAAAPVAVPVAAHADPFRSVVVFGDSLSDNGNLYKASLGSYPPPPYYNGRFSNGPVAVEQLASNLGVPLVDFAFGGATSGTTNLVGVQTGFPGLPGVTTEFQGANLGAGVLGSALTVVWGGANDFQLLSNPTVSQSQALAAVAASNIVKIVQGLQAEGATTILVPNLPDLGKTPEFYGNAAATAYTDTFNAALAKGLPAGVTLFDVDSILDSLVNEATLNPAGAPFSNVTDECKAAGAFPACNGYLFFDDIHPTTAADAILAKDFAAAVAPTPEPSSFLLLGTGLTAAAGMLRRRRASATRAA